MIYISDEISNRGPSGIHGKLIKRGQTGNSSYAEKKRIPSVKVPIAVNIVSNIRVE